MRQLMWCSHCQQDVPGIAVKQDGNRIACARCSGYLAGDAVASDVADATKPATPVAPPLDDWGLDNDLAAVTRMMRSLRIDAPTTRTSTDGPVLPHASLPAAHNFSPKPTTVAMKRSGGSFFAWPTLMLGMMAFTCGAVLLGWSFATGRSDLWTYGMPAVLAGQGLLVLGLILQLEGLWQSNRDTRETLIGLDRELSELRHATAILSTTHSAPGQSFYAHMAEGASPHLLLADVKGQLDVIAMRLAETRK